MRCSFSWYGSSMLQGICEFPHPVRPRTRDPWPPARAASLLAQPFRPQPSHLLAGGGLRLGVAQAQRDVGLVHIVEIETVGHAVVDHSAADVGGLRHA